MQTLDSRNSLLISILFLFIFSNSFLSAQNLIRGRVFDQSSTEALPGVLVRVPGEEKGALSDQNGVFEITYTSELEIYSLGYEKQIIQISEDNPYLNIGLKPSSIDLQEILVSAYPSEKRLLDQAGALAILSERDLRRDNNAIITPALNRVPGVYMHSGTFNTNRITIRGIGSRSLFSTNKVRAYLNDIPLTSGEGETTIEDIDLSLIDRVELIKGPSSSIYGAGLGGTINLKTKRADYRQTELRQSNLFGSYGLFRNTTSFRSSKENYNLNLIYNTQLSDGYRENNEYDRHSFTALGQFFAGEQHQINVLANFVSLKAFIPSSIDSATFASNPRAAAFTWARAEGFEDYERLMIGLSHQFFLDQQWEFSNSIFTNFRNALEPRPFNILREGNQTLGLRSLVKFSPSLSQAQGQFVLGGEYFREFYNARTFENDNRQEGAGLSDQEQLRTYFNIFFQSDWKFWDQFNLSFGFNLNQTQYDLSDLFVADSINQSGNYQFDLIFSPRIALNYRIKENLAVFAQVSHGFSPPGVEETLTPDGLFNPEIQPETGWNYEIGSRGSLLGQKLNYDISLYTMDIRNLLVARRTADDAFVGVNAGQTRHNGIEIDLRYHLLPFNKPKQLDLFATYTLADYSFEDFVDEDRDFSGNELTGVPRNVFNAGLDFSCDCGFYGNLNFQFVDEIPLRDDNSIFSDSYVLLNTKIGFQRRFWDHLDFDVFFGIQNLSDERYASQLLINAGSFGGNAPRYFYPGLPRNYFGGFSLGFIF